MKKFISLILLGMFLMLTHTMAGSNSFAVENIHLEQVNDKVVVTYDLVGEENKRYDLDIVFEYKHQRYYPENISGKTKNIKPGKNLMFTWAPKEEGLSFEGRLRVGIFVKEISSTIPKRSIASSKLNSGGFYYIDFIENLALPGLGHLNHHNQLETYAGVTVMSLFITSIGGALYQRSAYKNDYNIYMGTEKQSEINHHYAAANRHYKRMQGFIWGALLVYGLDAWYVYNRYQEDDYERARRHSSIDQKQQHLTLSAGADNIQLGFKINF